MENPIETMRIMGFPGRYVQGPGALAHLGRLVVELGGRRPVVVSDDIVHAAVGDTLPRAFAAAGLESRRLRFAGECTRAAVAGLVAEARNPAADVVVALGGGKTIDTAKGVARETGALLVIAPTVASNDSPTSRLIVLYDDAHKLVGVDMLARNPDLVLVDSAVIVQAPVRFFRAGIGDAISKRYEAAQCAASGGRNFFGGRPPAVAGLMADRCHATVVEHGVAALRAVEQRLCNDAVEQVIEATVLLSGLGFESGGLSLSHALLRGLTAVPDLAQALHGEMVAFGSLVQLVLEQRPAAELEAHVRLLVGLGLPVTLGELGREALTAREINDVAELTLTAPYAGHFDRQLMPAEVVDAICQGDALGRSTRLSLPG